MTDLRTIKIPKQTDEKLFESMCLDIIKQQSTYDLVNLNGRKGQRQNGVDIFARNNDKNQWIGIQCKVRSEQNRLTKHKILEEIKKANSFNPKLSEYSIWTTLSRDTKLQEIERTIVDQLQASDGFKFKIKFWDDIENDLKTERNIATYIKYYQSFFVDNTKLGQGIFNLMFVNLGIGNSTDSGYELALGKIPNYNDNDHNGIDYYRGCYILLNFTDMKMEVFSPRCFPIDIARAIPNSLDCQRVSDWINSIDDLDHFIFSSEKSYTYYMPESRWKDFVTETTFTDNET